MEFRIVELNNGRFRIQKKHWLWTFNNWWTARDMFGNPFEYADKSYLQELIKQYHDYRNDGVKRIVND